MKDAYYFPHDSNARHDLKIVALSQKWKYGYQWYFMTLEILREQANFKIAKTMIPAIAKQLQEPEEVIKEWLIDCLTADTPLFKTDGESLWSESLINRMKHLEDKREKMRQNALKRWQKPTNDAIADAEHMPSNASKAKQSKVKQSKVKKSIYTEMQVSEFEAWWNMYDKKVGDKTKVMKKYLNLKPEEREAIRYTLPAYLTATPDKAYRKHPATYLNNKSWLDEIIIKQPNNQIQNGRKNTLQSFE